MPLRPVPLLLLLLAAGCAGTPAPDATVDAGADAREASATDAGEDLAAVEARLRRTLEDLVALGPRRAGSLADLRAGDYLAGRFREAGLADVRFESFQYPLAGSLAAGRNVVGRLPGSTPDAPVLVVGAHYDTIYDGALDNTAGVAAVVEIAAALARSPARQYGLVFAAFDAEEVGLYGSHDFVRDHLATGREDVLLYLNLDEPARGGHGSCGVVRSPAGALDAAVMAAGLRARYPLLLSIDAMASATGGEVTTDAQGMFLHGVQCLWPGCTTDLQHTRGDTVDRVDLVFLADAVVRVEQVLRFLDATAVARFRERDPYVWTVQATTMPEGPGLSVQVQARDGRGQPAAGARLQLRVYVDDFTAAFEDHAVADVAGQATLHVTAEVLAAGSGARWLRVRAGDTADRAEQVLSLDRP